VTVVIVDGHDGFRSQSGRESKSRYAILGALTIEPMSGYQITELIGETIGHF